MYDMALEVGGRADKSGNQYENHFLGKQLLLLAEGKLKTVEVEPLGEEGKGVEFISERDDGSRIYYQCKASNGSNDHWTISALAGHKVFRNAKQHISRNPGNEFRFISPLSYGGLNDLCERARRNHSGKDFLLHQVSNEQLRELFSSCESEFDLSRENEDELNQLVYILSKCHFEQVISTQDSLQDVEERIEWFFTGLPKVARLVLENYVNDTGKYGVALSNYDVVHFMAEHGHQLRDYGRDETVLQRINTINSIYWGEYKPINGALFPRDSAESTINHLLSGNSVVLHGKAGSGKSGCVELISQHLLAHQIPHLRIKLDKYMPCNSSVQYGRDLDLPDSPVRCLQKVSGGKPCVLILDQLDALRWTASHSPTALAVCRELISQVKTANMNYNAQITILLVTRTFDYRNDARIRNLLENDSQRPKTWYEVEVSNLSDAEVARFVGESYAALSQKLKVLLRNPASLYVWAQLDQSHRTQGITSANQLIFKWWEQILERCAQKGLSQAEVNKAISGIAQKMGENSVFFLPRRSYAGEKRIVEALVSEGMLIDHDTKLAFSHQTFLDYFIIADYLEQLTCGKDILSLLGNADDQTPNLRYRFLVLLQELREMDECLFLQQSKAILEADTVRFYFKCTVFEAIAQCANPSNVLCNFVHAYWCKQTWREYIQQVVYYGNQPQIAYLFASEKIDCLSSEGLWLIRSIREDYPDFVVSIVKPYCFRSTEDTRKVYSCLCSDADNDSQEMFTLRIEILKKHPEFLADSWTNFYHLFKGNSPRLLDYLSLIIDNSGASFLDNIHFPEGKELEQYARVNYQEIVSHIIPQLCTPTVGMVKDIDHLWFSDVFTRWDSKDNRDSVLRKVVHIAKVSLIEMAKRDPKVFLQTIPSKTISSSLIGNELILAALSALSTDYSNDVVEWLLDDFPMHLYNYTGSRSDHLATAKHLLNTHSPSCDVARFERIEQCIVQWTEPASNMKRILEHRREVNESASHPPVYYAYWGFMQKELLPCLDESRVSARANELIGVLERNEWIHIPHYQHPWSFGGGKWVRSPISEYTDKISDKTWLQIIRTPAEKMKRHGWKETATAYIEATHSEFATSLGAQAKKQPARFAKLSLRFPDNCFPTYISGVLRALQHKESPEEYANVDITCEVIRKYAKSNNAYILECIAGIVESRADDDWPDDILRIIQDIALIPISEQGSRCGGKTDEKQAHELYTVLLNSSQGSAIRAITSMLFKKPSLLNDFKTTISTLSLSDEPFIMLALADCAVSCYNGDKEFACALFKSLVRKELRVLISNQAWEILSRDYDNDAPFYREHLISAMQTDYDDLGERAASFLCAVSVYHDDNDALRYILESVHSSKHAEGICRQAAHCFRYDQHRDVSKQIILHMVRNYSLDCVFGSEFFRENIVIERDRAFLLELVASNTKTRMLTSLLKYLSDAEENILDFAEVIHAVSKRLAELQGDGPVRLGIDEMIRCVVHLYDVGKDIPAIKTICPDSWDELFKNNLHDIKSLATILDNFS